MTRWTEDELAKMPTLAVGQDADLKFESDGIRIWLMRVGKADGYKGPKVVIEKYNRITGRWGRG